MDAELDLTLERPTTATQAALWRAWSEAELFARWWLPAPMRCRVDRLDAVPGGGFVTAWSEDGVAFQQHMDARFLEAVPERLIVFTNAVDASGRPARPDPVAVTGAFELLPGLVRVTARHATARDRERHRELGFDEGWGAVLAQLTAMAESL